VTAASFSYPELLPDLMQPRRAARVDPVVALREE
jgi:hypothetical protein